MGATGKVHNPSNAQKLGAYNNLRGIIYSSVDTFFAQHTQQGLDDAWDEVHHIGRWALSLQMSRIEFDRDCKGCVNVRTVTPYKRGERVMIALVEPCETCGVCIK